MSVDSEQRYVIINDLDPFKDYSVQVWASTSAGAGERNVTSVKAFLQPESE